MLKRCVVDSIAILLCMCFIAGCGGGNKAVDKVKDVANSKMETGANALGQATPHSRYAQFRALKLNCSYDTACKIMLGKPTFQNGNTCTWASKDDTIICDFKNDKLFSKIFDTKKIILKDPFSREQYNMIQKGDSYDTVKEKLNKQDGYLSSHYITPFGEYEWYFWRNPNGMVAEILFVGGKVDSGSIKNFNNVKAGANGASPSSLPQGKSTATSSSRLVAIDKSLLGKWSGLKPGSQNTKTPNTITITKSNSQTDGYEVELFFYRIANATGYAKIDGNKLSINQGDIMGKKFRGTIEKTNKGIRLTITESDFEYIKPGSVYEYIK